MDIILSELSKQAMELQYTPDYGNVVQEDFGNTYNYADIERSVDLRLIFLPDMPSFFRICFLWVLIVSNDKHKV